MVPEENTERARQIQTMFGRIVPRYDLMNRIMTLGMDIGWRRTAAALAQPRGARALDVGAGTGDFVRELRRAGAGQVVGADFSMEMVQVARRKLGAGPDISWLIADALRLPFPDQTFDCVTNAFLLRNLVDLPAGLREMARVLKPGGRLVCLDITHPRKGMVGRAYRFYFQRVLPPLAGVISGNPRAYRYLPNSLAGFPDPDGLSLLLRQAGLLDVRYRRLGMGTVAVHWGRSA